MAIAPGVTSTSVLDPAGIAQQIADLRRLIGSGTSSRTIIGDGSVDAGAKLASGSIVTSNIQAGAITTALLAAGAVVAGSIAADSISAIHLQADSVTAGKIAADAVVAGNIAAGAVQAGEIAAGAVSANNISSINLSTLQAVVTTLSALTSNLGSITAGTIQGATIQTAASGSRVVINSSGITGYALDGTTVTFNFNTGTGVASLTGVVNITSGSIVPSAIPTIGGGNFINDSSFEDASAGSSTVSSNWQLYNNLLSPGPTLDRFALSGGGKDGDYVARLTNGTDTSGDMGVVTAIGASTTPRVKPNTDYTISAYGRPATSGGNFQVLIAWYDASFTHLGSVGTSTISGVSNVWTRVYGTFTSPATAAYAACYAVVVNPASGFVFYFDAMQFEEGKVLTAYQPKITELLPGAIQTVHLAAGAVTANVISAGAVTAQKLSFVSASRNQLYDAGFEFTGLTGSGWSVSTGAAAATATSFKSGAKSFAIRQTGTGLASLETASGNFPFVEALKTSTASVYVRQQVGTANRQARINITWLNSVGGTISTSTGTPTVLSTNTATWTRITNTDTAPATAIMARLTLVFEPTSGSFPGTTEVVEFDEAMFEPGESAATMFEYRQGDLQPGSVGNTVLGPDSVTTDKILATTIQAGDIGAGQVNATHITAINLSVIQAAVTTLSAITADIGTITAGTLRGAIFETAASNPKVRFDATDGFFVTDSSGNKVTKLTASGGGIDFLAGAAINTHTPERSVRWLKGGTTPITLIDSASDTLTDTLTSWRAINPNNSSDYVELLMGTGSFNNAITANASMGGSGGVKQIIDKNGNSDFLQCAPNATKTTDFIWSQTSVTYPSTANNAVGSVTITHNLGATPVGVLALIRDGGSLAGNFAIEYVSARTGTTFTLGIRNNSGATQGPASMIIMWIAWV